MKTIVFALATVLLAPSLGRAEENDHTFRLLGLFDRERIDELRLIVATLPDVKLAEVDYAAGEATFRFDAAKLFPNAKQPEQLLSAFAQLLRQASRGTFEPLTRSVLPAGQRKKLRIPIVGLDCRGCSYGAYLAICRQEGVERATASFHDGHIMIWIDPDKTDRAALEQALTEKQVTLPQTEPAAK